MVSALKDKTELKRLLVRVYGIVQGVGFRPFVSRAADKSGVTGSVWTPCVLPRIMISVIMETPSPLLTMRITVSSST